MKVREYDGVVIGAGHNGMICAGYLAKAGLKVAVVERMLELGGGLDSHESLSPPGFHHNVHSVNHRAVSDLMWYKDLQLGELGQEYIKLPISVSLLLRDRRSIIWYASEVEKTCASIAKFSQKDAQTFKEVNQKYAQMARLVFFNELYNPPLPFEEKKALLSKSEVGREYLEWQPYSIREAVERMFENDQVRSLVASMSVIRGFEWDVPGQGFIIPAAVASGVNTQMAKGTSHSLAHTLHKMVTRFGADLIEQREVTRIIVENGRATGVELWDGSILRARHFVVSSVNPQQTFLDMVGREMLTPEFARKVEGFKYSMTTPLYTVHLALNERPRYLAEELDPDVGKSWYIIVGLDGMKDIENVYAEARAGKVPNTIWMIGSAPGQHDSTQAPPGKCTAFMWQIAPGNLAPEEGGPEKWDEVNDQYLEKVLAVWREYAPNLNEENIITKFGQTPLDIERHLPNMVGGDTQVGEINADQYLHNRPFPECSNYRTPIEGLYLCGSSCHPSGNITGAPGYNAAGVICRDLGREPWWHPHDVRQVWANLE